MGRIHLVLKRCALLASLACFVAAPTLRAQDDDLELEHKVEAAVLLNFARFVTWPQPRGGDATPVQICVIGDDRFRAIVAETVAGKTIANRTIHVTAPLRSAELPSCDIAYFAPTVGDADLASFLKAAAGHAVFSVHGQEQARPDAVARFYLEDRKVRFEINAAAVEREHLQVSAKLLAVAKVVDR